MLKDKFSLKRVSKNPATFDNEKLDHINAEHFQRLDPLKKVSLVYDRLTGDGILPPDFRVEEWMDARGNGGGGFGGGSDELFRTETPRLGVIINTMGNRLRSVSEAGTRLAYFYKDDYPRNDEAYKKHLSGGNVREMLNRLAEVIEALEPFDRSEIEKTVRKTAEALGVSAGDLIHPCRVALTGDEVSPDIFAVIHLLGRRKCVERLRKAAV
jgi:glutamyl-tRNA synthetase